MTSNTQTSTKLDKTLQNLVCSGRCQLDAASDYGERLKAFARENAEPEKMDRQSRIFKAFGDKTRLSILNLVSTKEMCVCELMAALELTQPTASHHLGILESAGVIRGRKDGKWVFFRIADDEVRTLLQLRR